MYPMVRGQVGCVLNNGESCVQVVVDRDLEGVLL